MEVENLLELEESQVFSMSDIVETVGHGLDKDDTSEKPLLKGYKGSLGDKTAEVDEEKLEVQLEETLATSVSNLNNRNVNESNNTVKDSSLQDGLSKRASTGLKPDFSWLKGEINLDKLFIRELQETFKATFGRKTSVKDKLWLKRRIAMGLTNSCDVSVTSFIIKDGNFLKKEEICKNMDCEDSVAGEVMSSWDAMPVACQNVMEDTVDDAKLRNSVMESGHGSDDVIEQRGAKRVRKPTKRYIEELSDKEARDSSGKLMPATKGLEQHEVSLRFPVKTDWGVHAIATRPDSIGGTGVQVPYVSRVRRCRPRKSVMALMIVSEEEKEKRSSSDTRDVPQEKEPTDVNSRDNSSHENVGGTNSDDNAEIVPTTKGGMRRKHHRAWTLTEVMKLVDGVSKFGAGRWSEIKRISFSSYSYRTSVDLKDKWRNLLKASFVNSPSEKGVNHRKNMPSPIPAPILVKVRELAEINGQAPRILKARTENSGSIVNENRSGYL